MGANQCPGCKFYSTEGERGEGWFQYYHRCNVTMPWWMKIQDWFTNNSAKFDNNGNCKLYKREDCA